MRRLIHLSDPHFGAADPIVAAAFLATASELAPDLTILSGDLTMRADPAEITAAKAFFEALPEPRVVIPGNHDMPGADALIERLWKPFRRYRREIADEIEPEWSDSAVHVVALNSCRPAGWYADWSVGRIAADQLEEVERKFFDDDDSRLRIVVLHHPLLELAVAGRPVVQPLEALLRTLERAKVDLVLCGHFHRSQVSAESLSGNWKSVISQASTVCSTRLQGEPQGFHVICGELPVVEVIRYRWDGAEFAPTASWHFERLEDGWNPIARDPLLAPEIPPASELPPPR